VNNKTPELKAKMTFFNMRLTNIFKSVCVFRRRGSEVLRQIYCRLGQSASVSFTVSGRSPVRGITTKAMSMDSSGQTISEEADEEEEKKKLSAWIERSVAMELIHFEAFEPAKVKPKQV